MKKNSFLISVFFFIFLSSLVFGVAPVVIFYYWQKKIILEENHKTSSAYISMVKKTIEAFLSKLLHQTQAAAQTLSVGNDFLKHHNILSTHMIGLMDNFPVIDGFSITLMDGWTMEILTLTQKESMNSYGATYRAIIDNKNAEKTKTYEFFYDSEGRLKEADSYVTLNSKNNLIQTHLSSFQFLNTAQAKNLYKNIKENTIPQWSSPVLFAAETPYLLLASPIKNKQNHLLGAIFAHINFYDFVNYTKDLLSNNYPDLKIFIFNKLGEIIFRFNLDRIFIENTEGKEVVKKIDQINDPSIRNAYKIYLDNDRPCKFSVKGTGLADDYSFFKIDTNIKSKWTLVVGGASSNIHKKLAVIFWQMFFLSTILFIVIFMGLLLIFNFVYKTLKKISDALRSCAEGKHADLNLPMYLKTLKIRLTYVNRGLITLYKLIPASFISNVFGQDDPALISERKALSILILTLNNFSEIEKGLVPQELAKYISVYFKEFNQIIQRNQGNIEQNFSGAMQVSFSEENFEKLSCEAALSCIDCLNTTINSDFKSAGLPAANFYIGIASGAGITGYIGDETKLQYAVLGNCVIKAKKISSLCEFYGAQILINDAIYEKVQKEFIVRPVDNICFRNYVFAVYELLGRYDENPLGVNLGYQAVKTQQAWEQYCKKNWDKSKKLYSEILNEFPNDKVAQFFVKRCTKFIENPPPESWDGVFVITDF